MKKTIALAFAAVSLFSASALAAPEKYEFDKSHTRILFFINHLGFSDMVGEFTSYDGAIIFDDKDPAKSSLDITIKPQSVRTSSEALDKELQNDKFFNSEKFPEIKFVSTGIAATDEKTGNVTGNATLLGVTKPVVLNVTYNKGDYHPYTNLYVSGFKAEATLKRSDFGMNYGLPMIGDEVRIEIQTELVNLDRKKNEAIKKN